MRVVHIIDSLRGGGAERLLEVTLPAMRSVGVEPAVLYLNDETECLRGLLEAGVPTLCLRPGESNGFRSVRRNRSRRKDDADAAARFCRAHEAQILHGHLHSATLFAQELGRRLEVPYVLTDHLVADDWQTDSSLSGRLMRRLYLKAYHSAKAVICVSDANRDYIQRTMGQPGVRCVVVENTVADAFFEPLPERPARVYDALMCGRLSAQKNYGFALEVFSKVAAYDPDFRAGIVGVGSLEGQIRAEIAARGLGEQVEMLGRKGGAEIRDLLDGSGMFFMPSVAEGLPLAIVEALARGLPAVVSDIPTFRTMARDVEGIEIVPNDAERAAAALIERKHAPRVARPGLVGIYSQEAHCKRVREVYKTALSH